MPYTSEEETWNEALDMAIEALKKEIEWQEMIIKASGERKEQVEQILINALRMAPSKDIQAILLETYIQEYGTISDENGEIVKQILMERSETEK